MEKTKSEFVVLEAKTDTEILSLYPIFLELRPFLKSESQYLKMVRNLVDNENCHFLYIKDKIEGPSNNEPQPVSIITYRIFNSMFDGKQLYVMDLGTISSARKKGYAGILMDYVIEKAKEEKCNVVTLESGYARKDAHRFYLNKRFYMTDHRFCYDINPLSN